MSVSIKSEHEIELMRHAGHLLEQVHDELASHIKPGISTKELDRIGEDMIRSMGCIPNFKNYQGFPASFCISLNDEVVHGIKFAKAGNHLNDVSKAIGAYAAKFNYGIVRDLVGHGIGTHLHEDPQIPNFPQKRRGIKLMPGMTLAIEPMINLGRADVAWEDDEWTVVTMDGSLSAHYENTILITDGEPEILTLTK